MNKTPLLFLLSLACLCFLLNSCKPSSGSKNPDQAVEETEIIPDTTEVEVTEVTYGTFENEIWCHGILQAGQRAIVPFEVQGNIVEVFVKNGQEVKAGQLLARLDDYKLKHDLDQAIINMHESRNNYYFEIVSAGYQVSDTATIPTNQLAIFSLRSGLDASKLAVSHAQRQLEQSRISAPVSGTVSGLTAQAYTPTSLYNNFCTILNTKNLSANFQILESDLAHIRTAQRVMVSPVALPQLMVEGQISEIDPSVDEHGLIKVRAMIHNSSAKLMDGMKIRVAIKANVPNQLIIPKSAVLFRQNRHVVFTVVDGRADWNYVTIGQENSSHVSITEGLEKGQIVITNNNFTIGHQAAVKIIQQNEK